MTLFVSQREDFIQLTVRLTAKHFILLLYSGWGIAAMTASRAYGDQTALSWAEDNWNNVYPYFITSGSTSGNGKNFGFQSSCSGQTMEGGVWWKSTADDDSINAITTGLFMSLSAMLYEATRDQKYLNAAELNYRFIRNHLYGNAGQDLVDDSIHGRDCCEFPSSLSIS